MPKASASPGRRVAASDDLEVSTYLEIAKEKSGLSPARQEPSKGTQEAIVILDFGSQYSRLIARRVRECKVYCEIFPHDTPLEKLGHLDVKGIILSGGPASVYDPGAPFIPTSFLAGGLPILGVCYGMQALAHQLGGRVARGVKREYGHAVLYQNSPQHPIFKGLPSSLPVWMSHGDQVLDMPPGFSSLGYTDNSPIAVIGNDAKVIGLQFHPEVVHTPAGKAILENFLYQVCSCQGRWTPGNFITENIERIQRQVGKGKVICALSGGVDSAVTAALIHRAVGDRLTCIFVNNGLLRREEPERVLHTFNSRMNLNLVHVDATDEFLGRLSGVIDPEEKRRIIGETFIRVFEREAGRLGKVDFLAQGTTYPDVIESKTADSKASAKIKTH
ncbi:MAG: glutamine-hydrolyzing GMP synthase, partial [Chloroflexi bacterium]|nr:glutamine-hydrolyzing GMP synthase [Chloroflexota bacterium]